MPGAATVRPTDGSVRWHLWGAAAELVVRPPLGTVLGVADLIAARDEVDAVVATYDAACSRFRADSEVARLAHSGGLPVEVSPTLARAASAALRAARLTGGAVDPTLGRSLVALGYDRDLADLPPDRPGVRLPSPAVPRPAVWRDVDVDPGRGTVRVPAGVLLDLGATGQALAADDAAAAAHARTGLPVLVALGGDVAVAGTEPGRPWTVRVADAPDGAGTVRVAVQDGGLATSAAGSRRWLLSGRPVHHLLDPASGLPVAEHWRSATVAAASAVDASTASTAVVVKGAAGLDWLTSTGLPGRLVRADGAVVRVNSWPDDREDPGGRAAEGAGDGR
jgi:thiamine biosynthesis lipoprotein